MIQPRYVNVHDREALQEASRDYPSWDLTPRQTCDLELIASGAFFPLTGFMTEDEAKEVELSKVWRGHFFPVPIVLDVSKAFSDAVNVGDDIALRDQEGVLVAILRVADRFPVKHIVDIVGDDGNEMCLAGEITGVEAPLHHDFQRIRLSPLEVRSQSEKLGWRRVLGFATRRPLHQKQVHETYNAARAAEANLLLMPAVGAVNAEDSVHYAFGHCYEHALDRFPAQTTDLALLPLVQREDGIRDALIHALVLRNYGCTHYLVDEDYCPRGDTGMDYAAVQDALSAYDEKLGIQLVHNERMVHCAERGGFVSRSEVGDQTSVQEFSRVQLAERLENDLQIPEWYSYPEIVEELKKICKPRSSQGFTIFFTGLSGSGKSTMANAVLVKMMEMGGRPITLLDGDVVRQNLSSELGFSKEHRDLNIRRIGYVASQITKHGGIAICAPIAPYRQTRRAVRDMIEAVGGFIEVYVATSIDECERRDRKGLYAKARAGIIKEFTGVSDPYEEPENPELRIDTEGMAPEESAQKVILALEKLGYIRTI